MKHEAEYRRELRGYIIGLISALILSALTFSVVALHLVSKSAMLVAIMGLAFGQIIIHFRYFLHITLGRSTRDDLQLILFSTLIILLMVGGTLVVLANQAMRM